MYAIFVILSAVVLASGAATLTLVRNQNAESGRGDLGALAATFSDYAKGAQAYVNTYGSSPDTLNQVLTAPGLTLATRPWGGLAHAMATSATWSLQPNAAISPTARDVCVELAGLNSRAAQVSVLYALPSGAYESGSSCAAAPAPGSAPAAFPATAAFRFPAVP